jgi:hypothetical protein
MQLDPPIKRVESCRTTKGLPQTGDALSQQAHPSDTRPPIEIGITPRLGKVDHAKGSPRESRRKQAARAKHGRNIREGRRVVVGYDRHDFRGFNRRGMGTGHPRQRLTP